MIADGTKAPLFVATAVATKRRFDLEVWRGTPVLLAFADYRTADHVRAITTTVRGVHPQHSDVLIVTVADMHMVPKLMRGVARGMMEGAYREAARQIPPGSDPANHLIILPDWEAKIFRAYEVGDVSRTVGLVLVDGNGRVHTTYQGQNAAQTALDLIDTLIGQ